MKSLHGGVFVWPMRWADIRFDPHAQQQPDQGGGEIPSTRAPHKARIIVKGEHGRQTVLAQKLRHHFQQAFGVEVSSNAPAQPNRGARIHEIGNFHHPAFVCPRVRQARWWRL